MQPQHQQQQYRSSSSSSSIAADNMSACSIRTNYCEYRTRYAYCTSLRALSVVKTYLNLSLYLNYLIIRTCLTRSESTTIICRFYDLCFLRVLWFLRVLAYHATLSSPEKEKYIYPKTKKTILLFKQCGRLSFVFSPRLVEISYAISVFFFFSRFVCVYSKHGTAAEPGAVAGVR